MEHRIVYTRPYDAEVEYLESTGSQWIDTGVKPDNTYTFDCKVAVTQNNYNCVYWGTRNSGNSNSENNQCYLNSNRSHPDTYYRVIRLYSTNAGASSNWSSNITPSINTMYEFTGMTVVSTMNPMIYPITLFAFNMIGYINAGLGKCRIGYWKCYSNGQIVRDFIPVRIGQIGYMYDKVSGKLFGNKGTGNFILGSDVANPIPNIRRVFRFDNKRFVIPMPYDSRVEYLKSDSNQYLDIGIIPKSGYRAICEYMPEKSSTTVMALFGQRASGTSSNMFNVFMAFGTNVQFNAQYAGNKSAIYINNIPNTLHTIELGEKMYLDGNLLKTVTTTFNGSYTISIFAIHQNFQGSVNYNDRRMKDCRVYSFKLYNDSDTLIFDGIPVRRGIKGYMYDKVSGRLFGNLGTGNFILGNDIND